MKHRLEQLEIAAREMKLRDDEKALMRQKLEIHMAEHPVRESPGGRQRMYSFITHHPMPIAILALAVLLGGGTSVAAAQALPGDTLYPMKTEVNEEVRGWFQFNTEAKAEFQAELALRRSEELGRLQERRERAREQGDEMSGGARERAIEARLRAQSLFETHAARMRELADRLEEDGQIEAAARIKASLQHVMDVHAGVRARLEAADTDEEREAIREEVRERLNEAREEVRDEVTDHRRDVQNRDTIRLRLQELFRLDGETETDIEAEAEAETESDTDSESESDTDVEASAETEVDIDADLDAEVETDAQDATLNANVGASINTQSSTGVSTGL